MAHSLALDLNSVELQHLHSTHTKKILPPNRTWTCVVDSALRLFTLPPPCWRTRSNGGLARQWSYWNWQERIQRDGPSRPEAEVVEILIWAAFPCTNAQAWHKQTFFNHPSLRWLQRVERVFGLRLGFPSKSHTDKWIKWAEKPNAAVWGPALTGGVQRVWPLCCFEALPDSLKVFIGMPRVHLWVTPEPPSKIQLEVQQIRVFIKQCRTVWLVDLKRLIWLLLGVFDPWADASDTEWPQRYNWFVWTEPVHLTCWKWEPNWEKENVWKWEKAQDCDWTKIFSHTQASIQNYLFRIIFITRGYRLLFPGVARLKLISFQSPQEGKVKPTPLLRRAALGSSENAIHLNKSN